MIRVPILLLFLFGFLQCKNYWGNPYATAAAPKTVPVSKEIRVEPASWWTGMQHNCVEIMVYQADVGSYAVALGPSKGVEIRKVEKEENPNYLCITLDISPRAKPQVVPLIFKKGSLSFTHAYPIFAKNGH